MGTCVISFRHNQHLLIFFSVFCRWEFKSDRIERDEKRKALEKYFFYSNRYLSHLMSLKFEKDHYSMAKNRMDEMMLFKISWAEVQFLKKSLDTLTDCRRTLMYTYAFGY